MLLLLLLLPWLRSWRLMCWAGQLLLAAGWGGGDLLGQGLRRA